MTWRRSGSPLPDSAERKAIWISLRAALLVVAVYAVVVALFILFCIFVWLR